MKNSRVGSPWLVLLCLIPAGCAEEPPRLEPSQPEVSQLSVAAASNLQFVFAELGTAFERQHPDVSLEVTYGSSGNFFAQLSQRAPFDLFLSADTNYPRQLVEAGLAAEDNYFLYAEGRMVIWVRRDSPLDVEKLGLQVVSDPAVKKIAVANPRLAPYGEAAVEALKKQGLYERVQDRLVLGDNVAQAAQFADSGAADVGILPLSLALAEPLQQNGRWQEIPADDLPPIRQAGVIPNACRNPEAARLLRDFLLSPTGREILKRAGYSPPKD